MAEVCGVMVGVRIRPFNRREQELNAQLCIAVDGTTTILTPPPEEGKKEAKRFTFDASFWSHDGFVEEPGGYLRAAPGSIYADQQLVFDRFGMAVLDNAWLGYHCCLFAYGQTGAGKSYSMVGYGANRGIVPIACEEIFNRITANPDPGLRFEVAVSMVEIYNEQVHDLLIPPKARRKGLEIRESQQHGVYIDGVRKRPVDSYRAIEGVIDEGTENRTVGSTLMNLSSSRAHTVLLIEFVQVSEVQGTQGRKASMINLVDLAGSEKAGQTGAEGDRLREGCHINKSLSALGNVIEKLADKSTGKGKRDTVVPYRDSKLTRLLQNALGGSSKTIMICAVSPASSNYDETLSTLRYADRAKRIKNTAVINENPQDKLIRQLREENQKLKELVTASTGGDGAAPGMSTEEQERQEAEIAALEKLLQQMQAQFQEQLVQAREQERQEASAREREAREQERQLREQEREQELRERERSDVCSHPHLANLNQDDLLTNKLRFPIKCGMTRVGRAPTTTAVDGAEAHDPDIALAGAGIANSHAIFTNVDGVVSLRPDTSSAITFVNGKSPTPDSPAQLEHGDRVILGQCIFVFVDPEKGQADDLLASGQVSYAIARNELAEECGGVIGPSAEELEKSKKIAEDLERKVREAEEAKDAAREEAEALVKQREAEFLGEMARKQKEWEQQMKEAEARQSSHPQQQFAPEQSKPAAQPLDLDEVVARAKADALSQAHAAELERMQRDFERRQRIADEVAARQLEDLEQQAKKAAAAEEDHRAHELHMRKLEEELTTISPLVKEANMIAEGLQRPHRLETRMHAELGDGKSRGLYQVVASVKLNGVRVYDWSIDILENRLFLMRELLQRCEEEGFDVADRLPPEQDPFWDPVEDECLIGEARILLEGLLSQLENRLDLRILAADGHQAGTLHAEVWPLSKEGYLGVPEDEIVDEPQDLLGTRMGIQVQVTEAKGLPEALAKDVRVEYHWFNNQNSQHVPHVSGPDCNPRFDHAQVFVQDPVTSRFLEYLEKNLVFRVYGHDVQAGRIIDDLSPKVAVRPNAVALSAATETSNAGTGEVSAGAGGVTCEDLRQLDQPFTGASDPYPMDDHSGGSAALQDHPRESAPGVQSGSSSRTCCLQ